MNKSVIRTATLLAFGALLASAANAALLLGPELFIDCRSGQDDRSGQVDRSGQIVFGVDNFDQGFSVNSNQIQIGYGNYQTASCADITVGGESYACSNTRIIASADSTPEPETWGLVVIGLSLAAVPVLRRKSDDSSRRRD